MRARPTSRSSSTTSAAITRRSRPPRRKPRPTSTRGCAWCTGSTTSRPSAPSAKRRAPPPGSDRAALDRAYADAMREVARRFPGDLDAGTLFADALMNLRPWNLWTPDGKPQPGTEEILATLERVLAAKPDHPGANHLYIHAVEASPRPDRGLAAADRLAALMPGAGH